MLLAKIIASLCGTGYCKGGGTIAAVIYCILWWLLPVTLLPAGWQVVIAIIIGAAGTWSASVVDKAWGKDSSKVVIDEVAGMAIGLLHLPRHWGYVLIALALFRFFDIVKPLGIRRTEKLPTGYGVMADDILAGCYTFIIMQLLLWIAIL
ncbi:MAG TPA: phosphatidylglycerophosphatase A [Ferruginibacter sp.]|nr:phosphatidylglycerophosphatase A [Ferruginibacter sp.]HMP21791.1 phosphatidylglycerophosphatase A [Ferruginibacter sp.]